MIDSTELVSGAVTGSMVFTIVMAALAVIVPLLALYIVSRKKETGTFASFGLGMLAYFWAQYLLPIPLLFILTKMNWFMDIYNTGKMYFIYILITSIVTVGFASLGRVWCIWLMNRRTPSLYRGLSSAIGFGAFKAMSIMTSYWSYLNYSKLLNSQGKEALINQVTSGGKGAVSADDAANMIAQLTGANSFDVCMEGVNVFLAMIIEMVLIMVIYEGFIRKKTVKATFVSFGVGTVFSFVSVLLSSLCSEKMGKIVSQHTASLMYDVFLFACALFGAWLLLGALRRYKMALEEGPYAHYAYFEDKKGKANKIDQVL